MAVKGQVRGKIFFPFTWPVAVLHYLMSVTVPFLFMLFPK